MEEQKAMAAPGKRSKESFLLFVDAYLSHVKLISQQYNNFSMCVICTRKFYDLDAYTRATIDTLNATIDDGRNPLMRKCM